MSALFKRQNPLPEDRLRVGDTKVLPCRNFLFLPVKLCLQSEFLELQALVDSGAEQSFIDHDLVSQLSVPMEFSGLCCRGSRIGRPASLMHHSLY